MTGSKLDIGRRRLINAFLGTSVGAFVASVVYPILRFVSPPRVPEAATHQVEVGPTNDPELLEKGFKIIPFGQEPVIVIRVADDDYRAFSATCTHLDCVVEYQRAERRIWCNCHDGHYDLAGRNVAGPPPRPLTPYPVHLVRSTPGQPASVIVRRS